ncbi:dimethylaniline monooxygenase [Pseudomassariella vexata]|uniref:Dimethylaniline monooxygenase n=1 Tax=Pseudomassariella vexata TaxID=1141098 RepID=A0A1Y2DA11_9PEZI|nr:dimethylaniline monooxygenase [Pseudomassariella vexata]ORY56102.1 dimethylaniline monooxygenase [Pseudomassariella vexata]
MKVAVIGGGPSGLVTLKYLAHAHRQFPNIEPFDPFLFEAEDDIGGTFKYRVYEEAELVSSKYLTAFSDHRFPEDAPEFVVPETYVRYLQDYVTKFELGMYIHCSTEVTQIRRKPGGGHLVTVKTSGVSKDIQFDAIAVCTGLNVEANITYVQGMERVPIVIHSSEFKVRKQFLIRDNPTVVIMGAGETGMDIGHLAITTPEIGSVIMCHKGGFYCVPKRVPEPVVLGFWGKDQKRPSKPIDTSVASLFDTAYVHPILQRGMGLWNYYNWAINSLLFAVTGTHGGLDQWVGQIPKERRHTDSIFFCKSDRAMPYISAPHRNRASFWNRLRAAIVNMPIKDTEGRHIDLAPWPEFIDLNGIMHFEDTGRPESDKMKNMVVKPDVIVMATGYMRRFLFLDDSYHYPDFGEGRGIWDIFTPSVGFIGFVRPSIGAIPPLAEMQAQLWVLRLIQSGNRHDPALTARDPNAVAAYDVDYRLHERADRDLSKERGGVDHESYAYQLALDIGSAPTFTFIRKQGFKVLWTWAMGSNFNTKFRLVGPWKDDEALDIIRGELYNVTKRIAGGPFFIIYTLIPLIIFGIASMFLYAVDPIMRKWNEWHRGVRGRIRGTRGSTRLGVNDAYSSTRAMLYEMISG